MFAWLLLLMSLVVTNFCVDLSCMVSWVGSVIELCHFLRTFLLTFMFLISCNAFVWRIQTCEKYAKLFFNYIDLSVFGVLIL